MNQLPFSLRDSAQGAKVGIEFLKGERHASIALGAVPQKTHHSLDHIHTSPRVRSRAGAEGLFRTVAHV